MNKTFVCYFYFVNWSCIGLGFHIDLSLPNIEFHVPFGFFRIGYIDEDIPDEPMTEDEKRIFCDKRTFGLKGLNYTKKPNNENQIRLQNIDRFWKYMRKEGYAIMKEDSKKGFN